MDWLDLLAVQGTLKSLPRTTILKYQFFGLKLRNGKGILELSRRYSGKESACNAGDLGLIPQLGRSHVGEYGNPLQHSCLENPHGQRSLEDYSPYDHKEPDTTDVT